MNHLLPDARYKHILSKIVPLITLKILFPFMAPISMCTVMVGVGLSEAARIPSS